MSYIDNYDRFILNEDGTSATGGPGGAVSGSSVGMSGIGVPYANAAYGGMGNVVSAQPGQSPGTFGSDGSGDVAVPYNAGGKKVFQKVPVDNRKGNRRRRNNKLLAGLKGAFANRQDFTANQGGAPRQKKVMSFDDFQVDKTNTITKITQ